MYKLTKSNLIFGLAALIVFALVILPVRFGHKTQTNPSVSEQINLPAQASQTAAIQPPSSAASIQQAQVQSSNSLVTNKAAAQSDLAQQYPVTLKISSIGFTAPVVKTGLEADGSLHVPSSPDQTGWYEYGPKPGEIGPAVITGHLDSKFGPGVLWNLHKVQIGNEVDVLRDDGSTAVFKITKMETYPQNNFATQKVYGSISNAGLRIITCSGTYSKATQHYSDDLVVYADLQNIVGPQAYQPQ